MERDQSRRALFPAGAALAAAAPSEAQAQPVAAADTPEATLKLLMEGNERYVSNQPRERDFSAGRASRTVGQAPFVRFAAAQT
jgi:carbonic anhydrase